MSSAVVYTQQINLLEIVFSRRHLCSGLIGYRPHDHRWVVLVSTYELIHDNQVVSEGGISKAAATSPKHISKANAYQQPV